MLTPPDALKMLRYLMIAGAVHILTTASEFLRISESMLMLRSRGEVWKTEYMISRRSTGSALSIVHNPHTILG